METRVDQQGVSSFEDQQDVSMATVSSVATVSSIATMSGHGSDSEEDDPETYYFESDHVALKGNPDYQQMLRTISVLEAQRIQAVRDLDKLYEAREAAIRDPIQFVQCLQTGANLDLPKQQKIAQLPNIHWEKYTSNLDFSSFGVHRHMTRLKKNLAETSTEDSNSSVPDSDAVVRGRVKTEDKPGTFNQLWTAEEQKRLEELLLQYPPEEVEARRWQKIATALGNRTTIQVQSRVQKYFIKLAKAGLPVPGRHPNLGTYKKRMNASRSRFQRYSRLYQAPSTFLQSHVPPVYMSDDDDDSQDSSTANWDQQQTSISDDESIPADLRDTTEYRELLHLKSVLQTRLQASSTAQHIGFKCDSCECEPIVGTRWHCTDCPPDTAVDFCDDCVDRNYETETHNSSHRLKPKHRVENAGYDSDYMGFMPAGTCSSYNYLDPNYMPANS